MFSQKTPFRSQHNFPLVLLIFSNQHRPSMSPFLHKKCSSHLHEILHWQLHQSYPPLLSSAFHAIHRSFPCTSSFHCRQWHHTSKSCFFWWSQVYHIFTNPVWRLHWNKYWPGELQSWSSFSTTNPLSGHGHSPHFLYTAICSLPNKGDDPESKSAPTVYNFKFIKRTLRGRNLGCLPQGKNN